MNSRIVGLRAGLVAAVCLLWAWPVSAQVLATSAALRAIDPSGQPVNIGLIDEDVDVTIDQQHATTVLRHIYQNQTSQQLEGEFTLRAGNEALVHGFAYWNGEQKIVGEVFEKAIATQIYDDTVRRKRDPGLLTMSGEGSFGFKVFPIAALEHKRIELRFDQWLRRSGDTVEYRVPVTRSDADIEIEIRDEGPIGTVTSNTHQISVERAEGRVLVKSDGANGTRNELVLSYTLTDAPWTMAAAVHRDEDNDGYLVLSLPAPKDSGKAISKDVTLVIDRSGSMLGEPLAQAKLAAMDIVARLDDEDRINVVVFDDGVETLFTAPKPCNEQNREKASAYIEKVEEGGGTDIAKALEAAFTRQGNDKRNKTLILLTDGKSDTKAAIEAEKKDSHDVRVFTVGLGPKVDKPVLSRLASDKRGSFSYVESASALRSRMAGVYAQMSSSALVGLTLRVERAGDSGDEPQLYRTYPESLPDLPYGGELRVVSRIQGDGEVKLVLEGSTKDGKVSIERKLTLSKKVRRTWVGRMWGRARVDHLLEEIAASGESEELKSEALELGLAYKLLTPYTAFLAVPEEELTEQGKQLLADARLQSAEALAMNPDAGALASPMKQSMDMESQADGAPPPAPSESRGLRGCANCAVGNSGMPETADVAIWSLLVGLLFSRRRRRVD